MTTQLNVPVAVTVAPQLEIVPPELIDAATVTPGVKPEPPIVTEVPVAPRGGVSVTAGVVIVKEAVPLSKLPSEPVAVTV